MPVLHWFPSPNLPNIRVSFFSLSHPSSDFSKSQVGRKASHTHLKASKSQVGRNQQGKQPAFFMVLFQLTLLP